MFEDAARHIAEASMAGAAQDTSVSVGEEDIMKFAALGCTKKAMKRLCDVKGKPNGSHTSPFPDANRLRDNSRDNRIQVLFRKTHTRAEKEGGDIVDASHHGVIKMLGAESRQGCTHGR